MWGKEDYGMLGIGVTLESLKEGLYRPALITTLLDMGESISQVSCGSWHTLIVSESGKLYGCGRGEYGRLGSGDEVCC